MIVFFAKETQKLNKFWTNWPRLSNYSSFLFVVSATNWIKILHNKQRDSILSHTKFHLSSNEFSPEKKLKNELYLSIWILYLSNKKSFHSSCKAQKRTKFLKKIQKNLPFIAPSNSVALQRFLINSFPKQKLKIFHKSFHKFSYWSRFFSACTPLNSFSFGQPIQNDPFESNCKWFAVR